MDTRPLLAALAITFLFWLIYTWIRWDSRARMALESRQRLRDRVVSATLSERVGRRDTAALVGVTSSQSINGPDNAGSGASSVQQASDMALLRQQLEQAQRQAAAAEQNDLELRRLRGELESLQMERADTAQQIKALELRIQEQQAALDAADANASADNGVSGGSTREPDQGRAPELGGSASAAKPRSMHDTDQSHAPGYGGSASAANPGSMREPDQSHAPGYGGSASAAKPGSMNEPDHGHAPGHGGSASAAKPDASASDLSGTTTGQTGQTPAKVFTPLYQAPSEKDNLKQIKGIGPVMERTLNALGVTTFQQLADFTQVDIDKVSEAIGAFPGRIERDDWVGKARQILQNKSPA